MSQPPIVSESHWLAPSLDEAMASDRAAADTLAATVAAAAVAEADLAAEAVSVAQEALLLAARTVSEAAELAAQTVSDAATAAAKAVAAAVAAKAAVVAVAAQEAAEARQREISLTHAALHDELTGLPNRRLLADRLTQALARSRRSNSCVAVLFLDLDHFKSFNDTHGHATGDEVLVGVARRLTHQLRDSDTCVRLGGDEFVVICEGVCHQDDAQLLVERLRAGLAAGVPVGGEVMPVSVSIGTVVSTPDSEPQDLLKEADAAMYRAKSAARPDPA